MKRPVFYGFQFKPAHPFYEKQPVFPKGKQAMKRKFELEWVLLRFGGYTLVEILVATTLSLLLLGAVIRMFGEVGEGITDSRALLESADRLRVIQTRLQQDLAGVTATMLPPCRPEDNAGYFEYIEGPIGVPPQGMTSSMYLPETVAFDSDTGNPDTTIGDFDDILMFTTRSTGRPFVGRYNNNDTIQSDVAEVAWFLRGRTLYRRVLLVVPSTTALVAGTNFYANNDISAHLDGGGVLVANTLSDLTRRECRYAHGDINTNVFPYDARLWAWSPPSSALHIPTLPTLRECSDVSRPWAVNRAPTAADATALTTLDFWANGVNYLIPDNAINGANGTRVADDVILTNVIGFDVKAWDPVALNYVDLGYDNATYVTGLANGLSHCGHPKSHLNVGSNTEARTYDTWSTHYESTGIGGTLPAGNGINGFDDGGQYVDSSGTLQSNSADGVVDSTDELITSPPYPVPLRGIQVKIRVFEPDSRQIREVTVVQDFLPQ